MEIEVSHFITFFCFIGATVAYRHCIDSSQQKSKKRSKKLPTSVSNEIFIKENQK